MCGGVMLVGRGRASEVLHSSDWLLVHADLLDCK